MKYNTSLEKLVFKEYGRNVQQLINYAKKIEDREERNRVAHAVINLMGQMHPHLRNIEEFRHKLWDQLQVIAKFGLDIDAPYPVPLSIEEVQTKPDRIPYPQSRISYKHYGKNVERLIDKAVEMEDNVKRIAFAKVIANYMKAVYRTWNRDVVSDELIIGDLLGLSKGVLDLSKEASIDIPKEPKKRKKVVNKNNQGYSNNGSNHGYRKKSSYRDRDRDNRNDYRDRDNRDRDYRGRDNRDRDYRDNRDRDYRR